MGEVWTQIHVTPGVNQENSTLYGSYYQARGGGERGSELNPRDPRAP